MSHPVKWYILIFVMFLAKNSEKSIKKHCLDKLNKMFCFRKKSKLSDFFSSKQANNLPMVCKIILFQAKNYILLLPLNYLACFKPLNVEM